VTLYRMARGGLASVLMAVVVGCTLPQAQVDEASRARGFVPSFLVAVEGGAPVRGWSLLHPRYTARFPGGQVAYGQAAAAADWSGFSWSPLDVRRDDDLYCVHLTVAGGPTTVPEFLSDERTGVFKFVGDPPSGQQQEGVVCVFLADAQGSVGIVGE
jgi:hypothetical protein